MKPSYCKDCKNFDSSKPHKTGFGTFSATCRRYKIGVNNFSDTCDGVEPQEEWSN